MIKKSTVSQDDMNWRKRKLYRLSEEDDFRRTIFDRAD